MSRLIWPGLLAFVIACGSTDTLTRTGSDSTSNDPAGSGGTANPQPPPQPASSCAGIAPPDSPPMMQYVVYPGLLPAACGGSAGDASGTLAFVMNGAHGDGVYLVNSSSAALVAIGGMSMGAFPLQQPAGVSVLSGRPYLGSDWAIQFGQEVSNFAPDGSAAGRQVLGNHSGNSTLPAAADPNGGVLLAGDLAVIIPNDVVVHAALLYEGGASAPSVRWGPKTLASPGAVYGLGVDARGRSLVITDGTRTFGAGTVSAEWFDRDGAALTGEFVLLTGFSAGPSTWFEAAPLIGSGLLVRRMDGESKSRALVIAESGTATVKPAPAWMLSRNDVKLQIARGGKAYAVLPLGAKGVACTQRVEIMAPDGTSCGATDYAIARGTCDTFELRMAADGTVIQELPNAMETVSESVGGSTCTWRWWPGAAR